MWPGLAPREYERGQQVPMRVNKLTSVRWQVPYSFYSIPFCQPHVAQYAPENLGEVLQGSVIQNAPFELRLGVGGLRALCKVQLDRQGRRLWVQRVREEYRGQLLLDNLPVSTRVPVRAAVSGQAARSGGSQPPGAYRYVSGYRLGFVGGGAEHLGTEGHVYVHNHLDFIVSYHELPAPQPGVAPQARVVGFEVSPSSRRYSHSKRWPDDFEGADGAAKDVLNLAPLQVGLQQEPGAGLPRTVIATTAGVALVDRRRPCGRLTPSARALRRPAGAR